MLGLVSGKQVERAGFSSCDNRTVKPPSLSEVERSHRGNLRRLAFSAFHWLPPKISDGQKIGARPSHSDPAGSPQLEPGVCRQRGAFRGAAASWLVRARAASGGGGNGSDGADRCDGAGPLTVALESALRAGSMAGMIASTGATSIAGRNATRTREIGFSSEAPRRLNRKGLRPDPFLATDQIDDTDDRND